MPDQPLQAEPKPAHSIALRLVACVVPVVAVEALGALATLPNIPTWYVGLRKPPLTPPDAAFGPAWTVLYALMAYALWRILARFPGTPGRGPAILSYSVQLVLNAAWSWAFFGIQSPATGLAVILLLVGALLVTMRLFGRLDAAAGWLLMPYLAWVSFATYLNLSIWRLNG